MVSTRAQTGETPRRTPHPGFVETPARRLPSDAPESRHTGSDTSKHDSNDLQFTQRKRNAQRNQEFDGTPPLSPRTPAAAGKTPADGRKKPKRRYTKSRDIVCKLCEKPDSRVGNQIVFCDRCNTPWHQSCHNPPIPERVIEVEEAEWVCVECLAQKQGPAALLAEPLEFGGSLGVGVMIIAFPLLMYYLWIGATYYDGHLPWPASNQSFSDFLRQLGNLAYNGAFPKAKAWAIYWGFLIFEAACYLYLPGVTVQGKPLPHEGGRRLDYYCSGLWSFYTTIVVAAGLHLSDIFPLYTVLDEFGPIMSVAIISGFLISFLAYFSAISRGAQIRMTGRPIYDFFMGAELNPRMFGLLDLKMFSEVRLPWYLLFLISAAAATRQYEQLGAFPQLPWQTVKNPHMIKTQAGDSILADGWCKSALIGTKQGVVLIGADGYARKIHYTADMIFALSWALITGFNSPLPWFYPVFFALMISHRALRDIQKCEAKYGEAWQEYKRQVPYLFIPLLYLNRATTTLAMLIEESHKDVSTKADGHGTMRIYLFHPKIPSYPQAQFPGVVVFSEIYQGVPLIPLFFVVPIFTFRAFENIVIMCLTTHVFSVTGPVARFARQIAGHGYIVAAPSSYHEFTGPEPLAYDAPGTDEGNAYKIKKVGDDSSVLHYFRHHHRMDCIEKEKNRKSPLMTKMLSSPLRRFWGCRLVMGEWERRACVLLLPPETVRNINYGPLFGGYFTRWHAVDCGTSKSYELIYVDRSMASPTVMYLQKAEISSARRYMRRTYASAFTK
ncbi:MAG: hypothetical protein Q9211_005042 [Gyalolechia sp. 1 TL-2023]